MGVLYSGRLKAFNLKKTSEPRTHVSSEDLPLNPKALNPKPPKPRTQVSPEDIPLNP